MFLPFTRLAGPIAAMAMFAAPAPAAAQQPPAAPQGQNVQVNLVHGRNFTYALPNGWSLTEEGQFALVLTANDGSARIIVSGNSNFEQGLSAPGFTQMVVPRFFNGPSEFGTPERLQPMPGYTEAAVTPFRATGFGPQGPETVVGLSVSNVVSVYARSDAFTITVFAKEGAWAHMSSWLVPVALMAANTGADPYGRHGASLLNMRLTADIGERHRAYREWSQQNWGAVVQQRAASMARQLEANGRTLTGNEWLPNPNNGRPERYSTTPSSIWVHQNGRTVESSDPNFDPRSPSDPYWRRVR